MATGRQQDVTLVVKARDEATRALGAIQDALQNLTDTQKQVAAGSVGAASGISQSVAALASLDKAYSQIAGSAKRGVDAVERQQSALLANKAQLNSLAAQLDAARVAQERMNAASANFVGPPTRDLQARYAGVAAEIKGLEAGMRGLQRTVASQESGFARSASSLGELERQERLAAAATTFAAREANDYTASLEKQSRATERNAQVMRDIQRATGLGRASAVDNGATYEALDRAAEHAALAARAERDRSAAIELTNNALRARARIEGNGGSAGRASDTGLAQMLREEEAAAKTAAAAQEQLGDAGARLRAQMNPLAVIQDKLNRELAELPRIAKASKFSVEELAQAEALLRKNADAAAQAIGRQSAGVGGGKPTLFGLKPYEVQNLSYQVNDVVTQLASGTSLTQTLAQQGGQILQIFPRAGSAIVAAFTNPAVLSFVATMGAVILGIREAGNEAERLRGFMGQLAASADGGQYGAQELNDASEALDKYGLSAEEAVAAIRTFAKEGVAQDRMQEFGQTASDLAEVMGVDLKDAAEEVAKSFTAGYSAIKKLDDGYNFLTAAQREEIRLLFEEGKASEARNLALDIFSGKMDDAASKSRGAWRSAINSLDAAWTTFLGHLADSAPIQSMTKGLDTMARSAAAAMNRLAGVSRLDDLNHEIQQQKVRVTNAENLGPQALKLAEDRLKILQRERETLVANQKTEAATGDTRAANAELTRKADADLSRVTEQQAKNKSIEEEVAEARRQANDYLDQNHRNASLVTRQAYIQQKTEEARAAAVKKAADEREREARAAKQAAEERRRGWAADIADNGREEVLSTARRFNGMNENRNRGDLQSFFKENGVNVDPAMTAWCAAFVNAVLAANGVKGTGSNMARSFLNFGQDSTSNPQEGDVVVLKRGNNQAQGHVGFFQGFDSKGNVRVLGGNQSDGVNTQSFNRNDVLGIRRMPSAGQVATDQAREQEKLLKDQKAYNDALDRQVRARTDDTRQLQEQIGLQGNALLAKQREAAIEDAIRKAREDAAKAGLQSDDPELLERLAVLRQVEGAYFDASRARDQFQNERNAVDRPVTELTTLRDAIQGQIRHYQETGNVGGANNLAPQLDVVNEKLLAAVANAQAFYAALAGNPTALAAQNLTIEQIDNIRLGLDAASQSAVNLGYYMGISGEQIANTFAGSATSALDRFAQAMAAGESAIGSLKNAFLGWAADFMRQIAQMIQQQLLFNLISGILRGAAGGLGGGVGGDGTNMTGAITILHQGGVAGRSAAPTRMVDTGWFQNAVRYHTGGIAGLKPGEIPAILEKGEEVLTRSDPRHVANGGGGGFNPNERVKNVVVFDPAEALAAALNTRAGEKALLTFVKANAGTFRSTMAG